MERQVYDRMAELDQLHWWYRARRKVLSALIARVVKPPRNARILEVGCGTGHNLAMLDLFGTVDAIEVDPAARAMAEQRLGRPVGSAPLPDLKGVPSGGFDLIGSFDVIEHIDDDRAALAGIARCLKPGGKFVMTVPAHQWMWSAHDEVNHHRRRYSKSGLEALFKGSPLKLERIGYLNSLLFPVAMAARAAGRLTGKDDGDDTLPPAPLNAALEAVFAQEARLIGRVALPPGLSLWAVASGT
ncbi:class I SAM-dependent methyltransferase [Sphingomonas astaxanthinifaciens]|uniref:Methyltransferase n=1 Tax=Sphingomonas astaxanthinifaciens DSM 22298 TaxID=1123267 RepID=A0ABQ5Z1E5_9SPHN|nr:class I SAM-dependent methyltransferase [Sphingomonas astaxanthinifaciens]GLR46574.1 methyltransferase [Sphingomonas astaxanthinifaciens DSM 22298]